MHELRAGLLVSPTCLRCGVTRARCHCGMGQPQRVQPDVAPVLRSVGARASA